MTTWKSFACDLNLVLPEVVKNEILSSPSPPKTVIHNPTATLLSAHMGH